MANDTAWQTGAEIGLNALRRSDRKQQLNDEDFQLHANRLADALDSNRKILSGIDREKQPTEYASKVADMTQNLTDLRELYHPDRHPNAVARFGHIITDKLKLTDPQQRVQAEGQRRAANMAQDEREGQALAAATGSTAQDAEQQGRALSAKEWGYINSSMIDWQKANPDASPEEKAQFFSDLVSSTMKFSEKPTLKLYTLSDGTKAWLDASRPDLLPEGATASGTETADTRTRNDFDQYKKLNPGYAGTFQQWKTEQASLGRAAAPSQRDDRFIAIEQKRNLGQPITADEQAYADAYSLYVEKRVLDPIRTRAAAMANDRYVQVMDLNNPEKVVLMRAGDAARSGAGTPQSIAFKTDAAITRYMTAGAGGQNINYFSTATDHLKLLGEAADALNNGDMQAFNRMGNRFASETGNPAPSNFQTVKAAVAGELSKTFKGTGATDQEIGEINQTLNSAMSPDQLSGAITYYTRLMDGKLNALRSQYEAGKEGRPAFNPSAGGGAGAGAGAAAGSKGPMSIGASMKLWADKRQPKTEAWVIEDLKRHGYQPVRP